MPYLFNCRICKETTSHKKVTICDTLPPEVACVECLNCGVLGIELMSKELSK